MDNYIYDYLNSKNNSSKNTCEDSCDKSFDNFDNEIVENDNFNIQDINLNDQENIFDECSICYDEIIENKKILKCGHSFHANCIDLWTKINPICPYCRKFLAEDFLCKRIRKIFSMNCKIIINEETFTKIIIDYYYPFTNKIYKSYIIPTTHIKSVQNNKKICILLFKTSTKGPIIKYKYKFKTNELSNQFSNMMKKIFDKYLYYYENELFEN